MSEDKESLAKDELRCTPKGFNAWLFCGGGCAALCLIVIVIVALWLNHEAKHQTVSFRPPGGYKLISINNEPYERKEVFIRLRVGFNTFVLSKGSEHYACTVYIEAGEDWTEVHLKESDLTLIRVYKGKYTSLGSLSPRVLPSCDGRIG